MFGRKNTPKTIDEFRRMRRALGKPDEDREERELNMHRTEEKQEPQAETAVPPGEGAESLVDRASTFDGTYTSSQNLRIEGRLKGEIHCEGRVTVVKDAHVEGKVAAAEVSLAGTIQGDVSCRDRFYLQPSGRLMGSVTTARLVIQEGAYFEGQVHMAPGEEPGEGRRNGPRGEVAKEAGALDRPAVDGELLSEAWLPNEVDEGVESLAGRPGK